MKIINLSVCLAILLIHVLSSSVQSQSDWITFYYQEPAPERFVEEVTALSQRGLLAKREHSGIVAVFLGRVMASNPERIESWMTELSKLPQPDKETLLYAVWLSDTEKGRSYLKSHKYKKLLEEKPFDPLTLEINNPEMLDMLWAYFFASGEQAPLRRIISAFNYENYSGSVEKYKSSDQGEEAKRNALMDALFKAALWSVESNLKQHQRVADLCDDLLWRGDLNKSEKLWLGATLAKALPNKYRVVREQGAMRIEKLK